MTGHARALIAEARAWGATGVTIVHGTKHPVLVCDFYGRTVRVRFAGSPRRDTGKIHIELARLRRALGVERHANRSGGRRRRNAAPEREPTVPHLTLLPDPWVPLGAVRERIELDCRCRLPGIDGAEARVERAGLMACQRIRAWADAVLGGMRA